MTAILAPTVSMPNKLRLNVITNVHDSVKVDAWPNDTVKVLKYRIAKVKDFNKSHKFDLKFRDKLLSNDNAIITDLKIKDMSNIHLKENHITGGFVLIKREDNQEVFSLEYARGDTILNLKEKLSTMHNIPVEALSLSANILNVNPNGSNSRSIELKRLGNDRNIFKTCNLCRNQIFLKIDEKYIKKSKSNLVKQFLYIFNIYCLEEIKHPISRDELMERLRRERAKTGDSPYSYLNKNLS